MAPKPPEGIGSEFLERYLSGRKPTKLTKHTISYDRWDMRDLQSIIEEMASFKEARTALGNFAPQSGESLMGDDFFSLVKAVPTLAPREEVEPTHLLNGVVMEEAMGLQEYRKLHNYSVADPIQAGAAAVSMEPKLEEIYDRLKTAQEQLQAMIDMAAEHQQLLEDLEDIDAQLAAMASGGGEGEGEEGQGSAQDNKSLIEEQLRRLEEQMQKAAGELDDTVAQEIPHIQQMLRQGMEEAGKNAETHESAALAWGLDPGGLKKMPPDKRIALAEKLNSEKFRKIAELFGPMTRLAMAEQDRKVYHASDEIVDIELGSDLERVLPSDMVNLGGDELEELLWMRDYVEDGLQLYKLQGVEKVAKGSIILCEDGSGSMGGAREIWAKAVALCLARICREQKRDFHAIHFGGTGEYYEFEFTGSGFDGQVNTRHSQTNKNYPSLSLNFIDGIVHFAEVFFGGGPLRVDQRCVTPSGWKRIGDMQVGDQVIAHDGTPANVIGVYPQGELDLYEVTFKDGAKVVCDGSHIWTVQELSSGIFRDMTLNEMLARGLQYKHDNGQRYRFSVPMGLPVELPSNSANQPLHPYLLGYLLGDGTLGGGRSVSIASSEGEFPWEDVLPDGVTVSVWNEPTPDRSGSYGLVFGKGKQNPVIEALDALGLKGVRGADKFVPTDYLWGSIEERLDILSGLLDSDGNIVTNGGFSFSNVSRHLCEAVVHLAQSLGGVATLRESHVRENEQPCWTVRGRIHESLGAPFKLSRKRDLYLIHSNAYTRSIVSAERIASDEAICIKVDRDEGLFMTEGFVVTHNTDFMTPLGRAMDIQQEQFDSHTPPRVDGDIVFVTDGMCGVGDEWMAKFKERQEELGFRVWGILIGSNDTKSEPLNTICDGRVFTIQDLTTGEEMRDIFRNV